MRRKALLTGASRGIGAATARMLAEEGYDLFLVCRSSEDKLRELKKELEASFGVSCEVMLCDVSDAGQVEIMVKRAGEVHVLINNAAISYVGLMTDMSYEQWHQIIDTNLSALFYLSRLIVPQMVNRKEGLSMCLLSGGRRGHLWKWHTVRQREAWTALQGRLQRNWHPVIYR